MIFLIKQRWLVTIVVTAGWAGVNSLLGGWDDITGGRLTISAQITWGFGGAGVALCVNGMLHEALKRLAGKPYLVRFNGYATDILDGMRWPHWVLGGLMAALAEETFFRGVIMRLFETPAAAITIASLLFALCHWLRSRYFGFWFWAMWEGVLFSLLFVATGSLMVPMIAHGVHDIAAYGVLTALVRRSSS